MSVLSRITSAASASLFAGACLAAPTADEVGQRVATSLTQLYNNTTKDCGSLSRAAYLCSGVVIRATYPSNDYHTWDYSPLSEKSGAVSFSYLRKDAEFRRLVSNLNSGFILYNTDIAPPGRLALDYLCYFPVDGGTNGRNNRGCGQSNKGPVSDRCDKQGVTTGAEWYNKFNKENKDRLSQCSFYLADDAASYSASTFWAGLQGGRLAVDETITQQNELRIATWPTSPRGTFPIRAFFYTSGGLENAKAAQLDYQTTSGHFAPIIQLTLPTRSAEDATFKYNSADQVAAPKDTDTAELTNKCSSYIQSASWIKRYDPGTEQDEWTLSLVPTPCGREIKADQTQAFYDELVQKYGSDAEWQENDGGGMRRQLVCHLTTTRSKEMWNLEPFRPEVSHQDSVAAGCNAIAKFIKSATWINRYDPGTQKNEWTLSVVPSVRGRNITPADTDNFYKELLALKGQDWQWRDNEKSSGSMRRQLVCLVDNYRSKQEWNLEPFRPYVTHEQATAKHCNPL
ncbi:DUF2599 domain-containing protein [Pseudomonas sp. R32]|uniref:DUF2599 domain-containing protein n=1 Tax=Pseudomonas sp. R32 TaxID=1573704 RepID=UPI00133136D7|nr:DUF2599 domain-containing protein [Pseudomonas sp. R32]